MFKSNVPSEAVSPASVTPNGVTYPRTALRQHRTDTTVKQRMRRYRARKRLERLLEQGIYAGCTQNELRNVLDVTFERLRNVSVTRTGYVLRDEFNRHRVAWTPNGLKQL